jgi:hypothetical protein
MGAQILLEPCKLQLPAELGLLIKLVNCKNIAWHYLIKMQRLLPISNPDCLSVFPAPEMLVLFIIGLDNENQ